jgi:hypothetical protein
VPAAVTSTGTGVVCLALGLSEWALLVPPGRTRPPRHLPGILADPYVRPLPRQAELVLRDPGAIGPDLGPAVLHYRRGHTRIFCPSDKIAAPAARVVSALTGQVIGGMAGPGPRVSVQPVSHSLLPRPPAIAVMLGRDFTILVCADLIAADLAAVLGLLCTAHVACLGQSGPNAGSAWMSPAGLEPGTANCPGAALTPPHPPGAPPGCCAGHTMLAHASGGDASPGCSGQDPARAPPRKRYRQPP